MKLISNKKYANLCNKIIEQRTTISLLNEENAKLRSKLERRMPERDKNGKFISKKEKLEVPYAIIEVDGIKKIYHGCGNCNIFNGSWIASKCDNMNFKSLKITVKNRE